MQTSSTSPRRSWRGWGVLGKADKLTALLNVVATALCAMPLYWGPPQEGNPLGFALAAPLVAAGFFVALVAQFLEHDNRHGIVRALLAGGAVILAIAGIVFAGEVPTGRLLLFYWVPAILAMLAATLLQKAHHRVDEMTPVKSRRH
jgi:peptidoglycan/LPS O-acetylase OafA/YrhL